MKELSFLYLQPFLYQLFYIDSITLTSQGAIVSFSLDAVYFFSNKFPVLFCLLQVHLGAPLPSRLELHKSVFR